MINISKSNYKDNENISAFRERLGQLRNNQCATQESISQSANISRQTLAKYEKKDSSSLPNIETLCCLCDLFNVSPNYLLGYSTIMNDHKKDYGLSDDTINLLSSNPNIHQFFDYFIRRIVKEDLEQTISQIGISNNVEKAWEQVFNSNVIKAIDIAYTNIVKKAVYSGDINSSEMAKELRKSFSYTDFYKMILNQDARNFIISENPDYDIYTSQEQYDSFIEILSQKFVEIKSIQYVFQTQHEKTVSKIVDIINDYIQLIYQERLSDQ